MEADYFKEKLEKELETLYAKLIDKLGKEKLDKDCRYFIMQWGKEFPQRKNSGILFVGRAVNGWVKESVKKSNETNEDFLNRLFRGNSDPNGIPDYSHSVFNRGDQMAWTEHPTHNKTVRRSVFWRVIKRLSSSIYSNVGYTSKIAWSNLYKVSPKNWNPDEKLKNSQVEICREILQKEIEILSPKVIILMTNSHWYWSFLYPLFPGKKWSVNPLYPDDEAKPRYYWPDEDDKKNGKKYRCQPYTYVDANGDTKLIIGADHPQGKPYNKMISCILKIFEDYNITHEDLFGE